MPEHRVYVLIQAVGVSWRAWCKCGPIGPLRFSHDAAVVDCTKHLAEHGLQQPLWPAAERQLAFEEA